MNTVVAYIDLSALQYNMELIASHLTVGTKIYAVIKANAYGHNSIMCAKAMMSKNLVHGFAVARLAEALELRENGIDAPILLLGGFFAKEDLSQIEKYNLEFAIHDKWQIQALKEYKYQTNKLKGWCQINIGMQRLGFNEEELSDVKTELSSCESLVQPFGMMAHLSCADEDSTKAYHEQQISCWQRCVEGHNGELCLANSAGCLYDKRAHTENVRPGIIQYGISPSSEKVGLDFGLKPVMTLKAKIISIRELKVGDAVGYGASWVCEKPTKIAIVAVGYADGYPRAMPNHTPMILNGRTVYSVGHVCMDMLFVDLGSTEAQDNIGDEVTLWGKGLPIEHIASRVNTIPYELVCGLTRRVKYEFIQ